MKTKLLNSISIQLLFFMPLLTQSQTIYIDDFGIVNKIYAERIKKNGIKSCTKYESHYSPNSSVYMDYYKTQIYSSDGFLIEEVDSSQEFTKELSGGFSSKPKEQHGKAKKYKYDGFGNITEVLYSRRSSEYSTAMKFIYAYNKDNNKIISAKIIGIEGGIIPELIFDTKGRCIEAKMKFPPQKSKTGELITDAYQSTEYKYDDSDYPIEKHVYEFFSGQAKTKYKVKYTRDYNHNVTEEIYYDSNGEIESKQTIKYIYFNNIKIMESNSVDSRGNKGKIVYQYDISGNLIKETEYFNTDPKGKTLHYKYTFY